MTGTSTAKALWEASCKCVPEDTQVWTLENTLGGVAFTGVAAPASCLSSGSYSPNFGGGIPLQNCNNVGGATECAVQTFDTCNVNSIPNNANIPYICNGVLFVNTASDNAIVDAAEVAFRNYDCKKRCWTDHDIDDISGYANPDTDPEPGTTSLSPKVARPCRVYLTAGSWTPNLVATGKDPTGGGSEGIGNGNNPGILTAGPAPTSSPTNPFPSPVKVEILKGLDAIVNAFVSCNNLCNDSPADVPAFIPDTLVDTSILAYAFNKGGFCDNYFDSNGNPIHSAAQFISAVLGGEDILFDCSSPINTGACGCLCANQSAVTINLCDYPCLASRIICTEKLIWTLNNYINCHRPRRGCGFCITGTV